MNLNSSKLFTKEDFDSVYLRDELELILVELITSIRSSSNAINTKLQNSIEKLKTLFQHRNYGTGATKVNKIYQIYKEIQSISLQLRKLLSTKINLEQYDSINYAFYIQGQRYSVEQLRPEWLYLNKNGLYIRLGNVKKDIDNEMSDLQKEAADTVRQMFQNHYQLYLNAITGMYKGNKGIGTKGSRLNKGHVAEAYERHLQSHYHEGYKILNSLTATDLNENLMLQIQNLNLNTDGKRWDDYETPTEAWIHIRQSLGNQRGTVAGDVFSRQVKQTPRGSGSLRLTSLQNLKEGIEAYSAITDTTKSVQEVAHKIALYLEEVIQVSDMDKELQAEITNRALSKDIIDLTKTRYVKL